jgi:hypothetical protein
VSEINWRDARVPNPNTILIHCDSTSALKAGEILPRGKTPLARISISGLQKQFARPVMEIESEEQDLFIISHPLSVPGTPEKILNF